MSESMGDLLYERKFNEMQMYIPFLTRVIDKLKNNEQDKPRKAQLEKMKMLHGLLSNNQKKLKIDTLLKCESVLKKLHAKIEKSDEVSPPPKVAKKPSTTETPSHAFSSGKSSRSSPFDKPLSRTGHNTVEVNTCPASPTQFGDEDFRPPVEIPTERRCSPLRTGGHWDRNMSNRSPTDLGRNHSSGSNSSNSSKHRPPAERQRSGSSRWGSPMNSSSSSSYHNRSWPSSTSSSSGSSGPSGHRRSVGQQRHDPKQKESPEEENWDDPEDEMPPQPPRTKSRSPPPHAVPLSSSSAATSSSHRKHRESSHGSHQHRHHEKGNKHIHEQLAQSITPLPDISLEQKKLFHDTIFKYKKPDPPAPAFNPFANSSAPELRVNSPTSNNIFNRLGEKVENKDNVYENFKIQVTNDKMKPKLSKPAPPPALQLPPALPIKPIDEVLKSPPLSADDIDDLLNESLEAANEKANKPKVVTEVKKDAKASALELVRKKLAMISKTPPTGLESPPLLTPKDPEEKEPFYRRGHTPTKKLEPFKMEPHIKSQQMDSLKPSATVVKNIHEEPSPQSPPNPMDQVIGRLALKYNPHRRRDSISQPEIQSPPIRDMHIPEPLAHAERLALKYNPHPRRESLASPLRTVDPRISKAMGQVSPLIASPIAGGSVPNVLPTINHFDPRLRNSRQANVDHIPPAQFCSPIQQYPPAIPSLLDINVPNPLVSPSVPKPIFGMATNRVVDPRKQKLPTTVYAEKFNPERNDQTERMKYLESKKKKPPEPKTYGEYRQSKCRQLAAETVAKPEEEEHVPIMTTGVTSAPSTLDKMYRTMDYGKELGKGMQGFKIPKKPKPEEVKSEAKVEDQKTEEPASKMSDEGTKKAEEPAKKMEEPAKKDEKSVNKDEKPSKMDEKPAKKDEKSGKQDEKSVKKDEKPAKKEEKPAKPDEKLIKKDEKPEDEPEIKETAVETKEKVVEVVQDADEEKSSKESEQIPKKLTESLKVTKIKYEAAEDSHDDSGDVLNDSQPENVLIIDENKELSNVSVTPTRRGRGRPKTKKEPVKQEEVPPPVEKEAEEQPVEDEEEDIKPRRLRNRRSTLFKDEDDESKSNDTSSPASFVRCRSASEIFGPSTDNSIVSTQNIISGKRRTRASINFNEKAAKKSVTPVKTTPANSPAPGKVTAKPTQKTSAKKPAAPAKRTRSKSVGKRVSDSGQICAVSSTTSQGGDAEESHNEDSMTVDEVTQEEPSSSGSKPQTPVVDADENQKKQEWLEGFLKSIVDPSTNKDRIMDMLKAVLDEKKLQQVKDILYSPDDTPEVGDASATSKKQEMNKSKPTRTKKNELDRLNEDIRDMFICQGVVTATGRRMCTLAKEGAKEKPTKPKEPPKEKKAKESQNTPKDATRQRPSATPSPLSTSEHKKHIRKAKVTIKPINLRALRSRNQKQSPTREMPVLEPNTPIKLPEEKDAIDSESDDNAEMAKNNRKRPGPKSKRSVAALDLETDEDDDIELVYLKKKIRKNDDDDAVEAPNDEVENQKGNQVIKSEDIQIAEPKKSEEKTEPELNEQVKPLETEKVIPSEELMIKNLNPEWHTMSDYASCCVICKEKARFIAPHYLTAHNNSEIYTSRLPPPVLEDLKQGIGNRALYSISKKPNQTAFHYRCPFCDFQATNTLRGWMEHFTIHTGEYQYKCSACFKAMNGCTHLLEHIKKYCPDAKRINREPINLRGHTISGYVCHLCNFIQMLHSGVVKHLQAHHDLTDAKSIASIIKVQLIESAGVPKMEENTELKQLETEQILAPPPAPVTVIKEKEPPASKESNMEVFLSRELASPTSDVLTERLKSIDQDEGITSDSSVNTSSQFNDGSAPVPRMTIAERLSQRFRNIEKQNNLLDEVRTLDTSTLVPQDEELSADVPQEANKETSPTAMEAPTESASISAVPPPATIAMINSQSVDSASLNESGNLVIDEEAEEKSTVDDSGSEEADDIDEDDNDNWEDIEITETKGSSAKDKNKNKSIFQTLSRLYASIAPKKSIKKVKEKEKKKTFGVQLLKNLEKSQEQATTEPSLPVGAPSPTPSSEPALAEAPVSSQEPTTAAPAQLLPPQISNLSDLLPDSPSDSLDMLLATNFNCLEGDGTSFPHLDLNDLESPIFLLPEDQTNLQDAIAMATDMDQIKYDVLGDPLPATVNQSTVTQPQKQMSSTGVQRIGNVGFSLSADSVKYYCMVAACTFLFSDHPDGLQNHFLLEHPTLRWNGFCNTCQAQVCADGGREMQHMLEVHSNTRPAEAAVEKPRIKFRRLTGDILSTDKKMPIHPPPPPAPLEEKEPEIETPELSLTSLLQSEPRAMIPPTPPVGFEADIPLYKNVSKEFTITGVAEGVTEDDLRNLVLTQSGPTPGGMQISQVVSLNAGGKSLTSTSTPASFADITFDHANSGMMNDFRAVLQFPPEIPLQRNSPVPAQVDPLPKSITPPLKTVPAKQPPFKCCVKNCKFVSHIRSAMHDHIEFHMRTDKDRAALKCHECGFEGLHTIDYFRHMAQGHNGSARPPPPSTNELTQKIQDILRSSGSGGSNQVEEAEERDPLEVEATSNSFTERLKKAVEEMISETGLPDSEVWKCPVARECAKPITEKDFQTHVTKHLTAPSSNIPPGTGLQCPHCNVSYQRPAVLRAHIKTHSRHHYFCYVCCNTFFNYQQSQKHFSESHARTSHVQVQALLPERNPATRPFLVFNLEKLTSLEVLQFGEKLLVEWERKKASTKTHFQPHEQYLLPLQPIFNNQVYCSVCNYKTKVRTNMFRHLQLHIQEVDVASVDPVNPVPCLEKNEKHFDKMLNLACSSNATSSGSKPKDAAGTVKVPAYVPDMRRFVCGHPGCTYLTITDAMLRSHLNALHGGEKGYQCPHCQEDICKKTMCAERIVQHLRFHGPKIYQCSECEYLHYTKHVVERHIHDKHSTVPSINMLTFDRTENEVNKSTQLIMGKGIIAGQSMSNEAESSEGATTSAPQVSKFKWECALCKFQTMTWNQMISHVNSVHRAKHQYHCVHCTFGSAHLAHIMDHIDAKHPSKTREAKYLFYKINETPQDKAADTRPLWTRDDPKRVRSIRGILMENEEDAERTKQSLSKSGVDLDDEDDDVEFIQVIESETAMHPGVLGCFHCDFKAEEMPLLASHWRTTHWHVKSGELVPKLPFFFRIHSILKCPSCTFIGDYVSLQLHASNKHGQRSFCAADPKLPNTCGHCPFVYPPKRLELLIRHYYSEHRPTDVKNLSTTLLKSVLTLGECQVYMQCYFCAEICADKVAIIEHERERHGSSNFRYKQIKDEVIYRCGMCQYSSTNEMATLRHMVDHFGGFAHCHFCLKEQGSFNAYMQHCYVSHSKDLKKFKEIYTLSEITTFLGQMLLIFPNGLIMNKRNLVHTQYGSTERITAMYNEICKKALEPPIPPLCMAQLIAKRSFEASEASLASKSLLPPPSVPVSAKRIAKRRSTVAMGVGDRDMNLMVPSGPAKIRKRKSSISADDRVAVPAEPLFSTITASSDNEEKTVKSEVQLDVTETKDEEVGVSFYGKKPEPLDLSKIYTQIAIADKYAPVSVKKFALLFKINTKVVVEKMDFERYQPRKRSRIVCKPCPASKKWKHI